MLFCEYVLVAVLGSVGAAAPGEMPNAPSTHTLTADIVTQPNRGTGVLPGETSGNVTDKIAGAAGKLRHHETARSYAQNAPCDYCEAGRKGRRHVSARRRHRRGRRHSKATTQGKLATKTG